MENPTQTKGNKNSGFILVHRRMRDHWIWEDPVKLKWWLDILMECNHEGKSVNIGFQLIDCNRGQTINSLLTWSKRWRVDISTVRRFFKLCETDNMIVTENLLKTTRLTVCNYDSYNDPKQAKQTQSNSKTNAKQFGSNSDAIQTKNELKNEERKSGTHAKNFKELTEPEFYQAVANFKEKYQKEMLRDFYEYWKEADPSGKMKFQLEKTWDTGGRLRTWKKREGLFGGNKNSNQQTLQQPNQTPTLKTISQ
jgi:hypothetical protein